MNVMIVYFSFPFIIAAQGNSEHNLHHQTSNPNLASFHLADKSIKPTNPDDLEGSNSTRTPLSQNPNNTQDLQRQKDQDNWRAKARKTLDFMNERYGDDSTTQIPPEDE